MSSGLLLTCPTCGAALQVTDDLERFACGHCGNQIVVRRSGGTVSLHPIEQALKEIRYGTDKTASELAIKRLLQEIPSLESRLLQLSTDANQLYTYARSGAKRGPYVAGLILCAIVFLATGLAALGLFPRYVADPAQVGIAFSFVGLASTSGLFALLAVLLASRLMELPNAAKQRDLWSSYEALRDQISQAESRITELRRQLEYHRSTVSSVK